MGVAPPGSQVAPLPANLPFKLVSKTIGQGAYASIRKATPRNAPHPVVAIKFINKEHAFKQGRLTRDELTREIMLHRHLGKHQNIIRFLHAGEDALWTWIVLELADGGDLFDKIEPDVGVGEEIAHFYFFQLMNAVAFMHSKGIAHRDLKPENLLLSANGDLKLADFGLAALFEKDGKTRLCNSVCGSPPYIAPEVVSGRRSKRVDVLDDGYLANICDIWSCGVVLFVLLVGNTPWDEPTMRSEEFKEFVETGGNTSDELWEQLPPEMLSLLLGILRLDPAKRFTINDITSHPWFQRPNRYLSSSGTSANPVGLAAQMLSQLRIDFTKDPTQSQRSQNPDAMDIDSSTSSPRRSSASPGNINPIILSPDLATPIANTPFDWERPPTQHDDSSEPGSDDTSTFSPDIPAFSQLPGSTQDLLSQDPSLSQFSHIKQTPENMMTLTQAAREFKDILPPFTLARFISPHTISFLVPLVVDALHRLNIPCAPIHAATIEQWERDRKGSVRIKMADGRRQGLNGHVVVERVVLRGAWVSEVRFVKASGDPLEWRRFFKNVVVVMGEGVVVRPDR